MALRRPDRCASCGIAIAAGERAGWESTARTVTCLCCLDAPPSESGTSQERIDPAPHSLELESSDPPLDRGQAGRSVTQQAQRRSERYRERQDRLVAADRKRRESREAEHPILGRALNVLTPKIQVQPAPQYVRSWATGAPGEHAVGESLDQIPGIVVLHDRCKAHSKANIDHIAITPAGVWAIDAKVRPGKKLEFRDRGGMFRRDERLVVGGRDETKLIKDMAWQVEAVQEACGELLGNTVVRPALCFVDATVGLLTRKPWMVRGVVIAWRAVLPEILTRPGPFGPEDIDRIVRRIADRLPSA